MFEEAYQSWARKVVHAREVAKSVALILSQMCDPQRHSGEGKAKSQTSEWEHQAKGRVSMVSPDSQLVYC